MHVMYILNDINTHYNNSIVVKTRIRWLSINILFTMYYIGTKHYIHLGIYDLYLCITYVL